MEADRVWQVATNPAWRPFTDVDLPGYVALLACAAFLVALTIWTYTGSAAGTPRRVGTLIALRLVALLLAILLAIRPSAAITEIPKLPSTLLVVVDASESMSVKDEANFTRWEVVRKALDRASPILDRMRDDQQTTVHVYHFSKDFDPDRDKLTDDVKPEGKRTDFGTMLSKLYERHQGDGLLRGLVIVSDGADNGIAKPALPEAARWRGIGCPVYCLAVGGPTATDRKDIGFTSINPDPSPVAIKSELKVRARLNAPGFDNVDVRVELTVEGVPPKYENFKLSKTTDNEIEMTTKAPDTPGEVKVKMRLVDPPLGQATTLNDEIETYLTVTREGVRVLVISKDGWELRGIRHALSTDRRFDYVEAVRASEAPGTLEEAKQYDLAEGRYDVIILGDVTPKMLTSVRPTILDEMKRLVLERGVGLMMTGGAYTFGGTAGTPGATGWAGTPVADLLPVVLPADPVPDVKEPTAMVPTDRGLEHFLLRFSADPRKNQEAWDLLNNPPRLQGYTALGQKKERAEVLARANDKVNGPPLLVRIEASDKGRVLAFGAADTWRWLRPSQPPDPNNLRATADLHTRFWKQTVLWLAHQDEMEGNVYVRPEFRRLVAGGRQNVRMGVRDKRGDEIPEADIRYQVLGPGEQPDRAKATRAERDPKGGGRASFESRVPGEYRVVAWGEATDGSGEKISDSATARYVVFPDISDEMLRPAANPEFLLALQNTANGTSVDVVPRAEKLTEVLERMKNDPPKVSTPKAKAFPDWRRDRQKFFLPAVLILFVLVLGLEWGLRRAWGMV